ncbi:MAG: hypothetical protein KGH52_02465 [Candidatus Micrarchaeota archaeon]|nr:hypothetical protein [Candidatus Micrarchaeota archaeon]
MPRKIAKKAQKAKGKKAPGAKRPKTIKVRILKSVHDDLEGYLIERISKPGQRHSLSSTLLPELLYSVSPATKGLAYNAGYTLGMKLSMRHNMAKSITPLINALENAGFSRILYHPHKRDLIIEATHEDCDSNAKKNLHAFEAGLIAGYLTESTGKSVSVAERQCTHNRRSFCQFVIEYSPQLASMEPFEGVREMVGALEEEIRKGEMKSRASDEYQLLQMLPLSRGELGSEISKLLYAVGGMLVEDGIALDERGAKSMRELLGLKKIELTRKKGAIQTVRLDYKIVNSMKGYADITSALVVGMLHSTYKRMPERSSRLNSDGSYTMELRIA